MSYGENDGGTAQIVCEPAPGPAARERFCNIIGRAAKMREMYRILEAVASSPVTILISGESGAGKRVAAQAIHLNDAARRHNSFVEVSCGALPENLLESELFGHVRGAFTGAIKDRQGRFERAQGGTIFLDEIDTCSPALQVKLLRVLEEGIFERVGETASLKSDARVIAATNQNLEELVRKNAFRGDLYWRLNVINIRVPALRERREDIPLLIGHFFNKHRQTMRHSGKEFIMERVSDAAMEIMMSYPWPGNVRELQNIIERACVLAKTPVLEVEDLPDALRSGASAETPAANSPAATLKNSLRDPEKEIIAGVLDGVNWNCSRAAARLGINRTTLYKKIKRYELARSGPSAAAD